MSLGIDWWQPLKRGDGMGEYSLGAKAGSGRMPRLLPHAGSSLLVISAVLAASPGQADTVISTSSSQLVLATENVTITDTGTLTGLTGVVIQNANVGTVVNNGTLQDVNWALVLGTFGSLGGTPPVPGTLGALINTGTMFSNYRVIEVMAGSSLGSLSNSGTIRGVVHLDGSVGPIMGGTDGTVGVFTGLLANLQSQGTIVSTLNNLTLASGALLLNDTINMGTNTLVNSGADVSLISITTIVGSYSQTAGGLELTGNGKLVVTGAALISGGSIASSFSDTGNYIFGTTYATLVAGGAGSSYRNVYVDTGTIASLWAIISGNNLQVVATGDYVGGSLGSLTNSGSLLGDVGLTVASTGTLGSFRNTGTIAPGTAHADVAIGNDGTIGTLTNSGHVSQYRDIVNTGSIGTLANEASGTLNAIVHGNSAAIYNTGTIGALINAGQILTSSSGHSNQFAVGNYGGSIGQLTNSGTIMAANHRGIVTALPGGTTGTIVNTGLISAQTGVMVRETAGVGALINSGTINALNAVYMTTLGSLGTLINSGVIAGRILTSNPALDSIGYDLTIQGGTAGTVGTITGQDFVSKSVIYSTHSDVIFASGALLLNADLTGTGHSFRNDGADLTIVSNLLVQGSYLQSAGGTLELTGNGGLTVTDQATLAGTLVVGSATGNYTPGSVTLLSAARGLDYSAATLVGESIVGLEQALGNVGNTLLAIRDNYYVGGILGSLSNTFSVAATTALYVAATGSIGTLANSGTLIGAAHGLYNAGIVDALDNSGSIGASGNTPAIGSSDGIDNRGSIGSLTNRGTIGGANTALYNAGIIGSLTNSGSIGGGNFGLRVSGGGIASLSNSGTIGAVYTGLVVNSGSVDRVDNEGAITGSLNGVAANGGTITDLVNAGAIRASSTAIDVRNLGRIGAIANSGTISGQVAINVANLGRVDTIANSGLIQGDIANATANALTILGGTGGMVGSFTGGRISSANADLEFASGAISLGDEIYAGTNTVRNSGASLALAQDITVTGNFIQTDGTLALGGNTIQVRGAASITGGTVAAGLAATGNYQPGHYLSLIEGGLGSDYSGATVAFDVAGLAVQSEIVGSVLMARIDNEYVGGTLARLDNGNTISGVTTAAYVATTGSIGTLANTGTLDGSFFGIRNEGIVDVIDNSGLATGEIGLYNRGTIGTLRNSGTLADAPAPMAAGLNNAGAIAAVENDGTISGASYGIYNSGSIGSLSNYGLITGATALFVKSGATLGAIANSGTFEGNIVNQSANDLVFRGGDDGTIGTLTGGTIINTASDLIFASGNLLLQDEVDVTGHALVNGGASILLDTVVNITGDYRQASGTLVMSALTQAGLEVSGAASITGGTIAMVGLPSNLNVSAGTPGGVLVTGGAGSTYDGVRIDSGVTGFEVGSRVSGNTLLVVAANNYVGGTQGSLTNSGTLSGVLNPVYVAETGSLGTLANSGTLAGVGAGVRNLGRIDTLTNTGSMHGNTIGLYNYGSLSSVGLVYNGGTISGILGVVNDGSIGLLRNSGLLTGSLFAINSGGRLDTIVNTGTIAGNIANLGSSALTLIGSSSSGARASFTGYNDGLGTIRGSGADLIFASGSALLNVRIDVGAGTVRNSGADLQLASALTITGNYSQTAGILALGMHALMVSGVADLSGGTLTTDKLTADGNYLVGGTDGLLVQGGAGSRYDGVSILSGISGFAAQVVTATDGANVNLLLDAANDYVGGTLARIDNDGSIGGVATAAYIAATGSVGTLANTGSLDGALYGIRNFGVLDAIENRGTISGATAVYVDAGATLGRLTNSGTISGNVVNQSANALMLTGGDAGSAPGVFTGGTIISTGADVVLASGKVVLGDAVDVTGHTLANSGAAVTLAGYQQVRGGYSQTGGSLDLNGYELSVTGAAHLSGGSVNAGLAATGNYLTGATTTLVAGGAGSSYEGVVVGSGVTGLSATGSTSGNALVATAANDYIGGAYGTLSVSGTLGNAGGGATAVYVAATGSLGQLANSGTVIGNVVNASGNALTLAGSDAGSAPGTFTGGTIASTGADVVLASGKIVLDDAVDVTGHALVNDGASVLLTDTVTVAGDYAQNAGTLAIGIGSNDVAGLLDVSGSAAFTGGAVAVDALDGAILLAGQDYTIAQAAGGITATGLAAQADGFSASLDIVDNGAVSDLLLHLDSTYIGGAIDVVTNSGTISAPTAVYIAANGTLGTLANNGVIDGNIINQSANVLTITGQGGSFTGGTIVNTNSDLVFAPGTIGMGDAIDVGGNTVVNAGGTLTLTDTVSVTGNFSQNSGTLDVDGHVLEVSGAAVVTGGTVSAGLEGQDNYIVGDSVTLIAGGVGSDYSGASVTSGVTGLSATGAVSGDTLMAVAANDYIGGSYGTLAVNGALAAPTGGAAIYIAATGSLGQLANSGTITGNIVNLSPQDLVIAGGAGGVTGTFGGGTIASSGADVRFVSGAISLGDAIQTGSHAVVNSGAAITLADDVAVAGNFEQSDGLLDVDGHVLTVSGAASITGGTVTTDFAPAENYLVGDGTALVAGGTGSDYSGATVVSQLEGLSATGAVSGDTLTAVAANDYIGGSYGMLSIAGTLANGAGNGAALYIAATGDLAGLVNDGTVAGDIVNLSTHDLIVSGGTDAAPGVLTGAASNTSFAGMRAMAVAGGNGPIGLITNTASNLRFTGGAQLLNSNVDVGTHAMVNSGATLLVNSEISITGDFSQSAGRLVFGVSSLNQHGSLTISGTGALTGGAIALNSFDGPLQAGTYTILSAGDGLSMNDLIFEATGYKVTGKLVSAGAETDLVLTVAGLTTNYAPLGRAQGGAAIGTALALDRISAIAAAEDTTTPEAAAFNVGVLAPLADLAEPQQRGALSQLSPSQLTPQLMAMATAPVSMAIGQHQQVVSAELATGADTSARRGALWGEFLGGTSTRDTTREAAGFDASTSGVLVGADWYGSANVSAGVAFSWFQGIANGAGIFGGSRTKLDSYQLTAYGAWRPEGAGERLAIEGQLGAGLNRYDQRRTIDYLGARASAKYGGEQYMARLLLGYDLPVAPNLVITPQYALRAARVTGHHYAETGAGAAGFEVARLTVDALTQEVGLKFGGSAGGLAPDLRVTWVHDYANGGIDTMATAGGVAFASATGRLAADGVAVGAGVTLRPSEGLRLRLEYTGDIRSGYQSNSGALRLSWDF